MATKRINPKLYVSAQLKISDFGRPADQGITLILHDRPDCETSEQTGSIAEAEATRDAGMDFPVYFIHGRDALGSRYPGLSDIYDNSRGPVPAHCKSGTCLMTLRVLGEVLDEHIDHPNIVKSANASASISHWQPNGSRNGMQNAARASARSILTP